jgi:predicted GNAT family acetyltransferase
MAIEVSDNPGESRYDVLVDGGLAGFARYRLHGERITFFHTEVDPAHEGQGVGSTLARGALDDVRRRGLEVVPLCPFIAAFIGDHAGEYLDLVVPAMRERLTGEEPEEASRV